MMQTSMDDYNYVSKHFEVVRKKYGTEINFTISPIVNENSQPCIISFYTLVTDYFGYMDFISLEGIELWEMLDKVKVMNYALTVMIRKALFNYGIKGLKGERLSKTPLLRLIYEV
jgi:hypothetical protein